VDAYVRRLIRDGYPIELFLEGGRSRTGKLLEPKFGMLNMIVDAVLNVPQTKVYFVPISIGYERIIEGKSYQRELAGGEKKKEEAADLLNAGEVLRHRYGRINLQIGQILSLNEVSHELGFAPEEMARPAKRRAAVMRLGNRVMDEINRVTAVTPGAVTALALLTSSPGIISEDTILDRSARLLALLVQLGARITSPTSLPDGSLRAASVREALQMYVEAELIRKMHEPTGSGLGPSYQIVTERRLELDTSKNSIIHFFVTRALVASSLNRTTSGNFLGTPIEALRVRVHYASRLFKHEFRFRADASFDTIFDETLSALRDAGHLVEADGHIAPGPGGDGWDGRDWLDLYRQVLEPYFEGYWVAARSLENLLSTELSEKELVKEGLALGHQLLGLGHLKRREAVSKPTLQNALHALCELGYARTRQEKFELGSTYHDPDLLRALASQIGGFLTGIHGAFA
jgi:glycerol-3-phosphate O-acyltransferase